jgi:hypothetical protein
MLTAMHGRCLIISGKLEPPIFGFETHATAPQGT